MTADNRPENSDLAYKRVLLKISGEALMGEQNYGIDVDVAHAVAEELKAVHERGVQVAVVVGGGNIFRGVSKSAGKMDRSAADYIGMLATVMNAVVPPPRRSCRWRYPFARRSSDVPLRASSSTTCCPASGC